MQNNIISSGISDTAVFLQNAANVKAGFDIKPSSGQFPAFGDVLVNRRLASMWQVVHLDERIFVDGLGITSMNAESEDASAVRIPMLVPPPRRMRTLDITPCGTGKHGGTPGNSGPFNNNLPNQMQTNAVDIWFKQVYDEAAQISKDQAKMIGNRLDILSQHTSYIPQLTAMLMDSEIIATQVGAALSVANNDNILDYDPEATTQGYMQSKMNDLATSLSNIRNGYIDGMISYPVDKTVYVLRYKAFNKLMNINNGAIINSDIGQKILLNGKFDETGSRYLGGAVRGTYGGILIKVVPDEYWDMAAALNNLTPEQKAQWDKVDGYIANGLGTYFGRAAVETDIDKAPTTSIGYIVRNNWRWGTTVTRRSSITLLVDNTTGGTFVNPIGSDYDGVIAPNDVEAVLATYRKRASVDADGTLQRVGFTSSTLTTDVTLKITGAEAAPIDNATLRVVGDGATRYSFGNNGDGSYTFTLPRGSVASVEITAPGYNTTTLTVTVSDTALATKELTQTLTATTPARSANKSDTAASDDGKTE